MENTYLLSDLKKEKLGDKASKILEMLSSKPMQIFLKLILKDGELLITTKSITLNGKEFKFGLVGKQEQAQMAENGVKEVSIRENEVSVVMSDKEKWVIKLD
jgi:hypothetical protein